MLLSQFFKLLSLFFGFREEDGKFNGGFIWGKKKKRQLYQLSFNWVGEKFVKIRRKLGKI